EKDGVWTGDSYRFGLLQTTAPEGEPLDLATVKRHLYEDGDHNDADIRTLISEARQWCEEQTEAQLLTATWTMTLDRFPGRSKWLRLSRWPVRTVEAIQYTAPDGTASTVASADIALRK